MHPEAAFLDTYALALVALATALTWLARHDSKPQNATILRASRNSTAYSSTTSESSDWPHSEAPQLHLVIGAVATTAALVLAVASIIRHHEPIELGIGATLITIICTRAGATVRARRRGDGLQPPASPR